MFEGLIWCSFVPLQVCCKVLCGMDVTELVSAGTLGLDLIGLLFCSAWMGSMISIGLLTIKLMQTLMGFVGFILEFNLWCRLTWIHRWIVLRFCRFSCLTVYTFAAGISVQTVLPFPFRRFLHLELWLGAIVSAILFGLFFVVATVRGRLCISTCSRCFVGCCVLVKLLQIGLNGVACRQCLSWFCKDERHEPASILLEMQVHIVAVYSCDGWCWEWDCGCSYFGMWIAMCMRYGCI